MSELKLAVEKADARMERLQAYQDAQLPAYRKSLESFHSNERFRVYPHLVSVETYAVCNAACGFCPYPTMERKGDEMSEETFEKLVRDLAESDPSGPVVFTLARINEPLLDKRFFDFCRHVERVFPKTWHQHFTNGSPLNRKNFDRLLELKRTAVLNISFNDHRKDAYEASMRLPYERTLKNISEIHDRLAAKEFSFMVKIRRVGDGSVADQEFNEWVQARFPLFQPQTFPRFDWLGKVNIDEAAPPPDLGCGQWFQLHFMASGQDLLCCTDSNGDFGIGNVMFHHAVRDIYNHPGRRALREKMPSRKSLKGPCATCAAFL